MTYRIHEVANMFPMLAPGSREFNDLEEHIRLFGQIEPIVLDGDVLLDGRNRLAICEGLGITPKTVQWSTMGVKCQQHEWIYGKNKTRRHLTDDQRAAVTAEYMSFESRYLAEHEKEKTQFKPGVCPNPNGRAGKEQVNTNSDSPVKPKRDTKKMNEQSTVGKVAAAAGVSHHKAAQAVALHKAATSGDGDAKEDMEAVKAGLKKLCEITKAEKQKTRPPKPIGPRIEKAWLAFRKNFTDSEWPEVIKWVGGQL